MSRFLVVGGSQSGHDCCFACAIVDTTKIDDLGNYESLCECYNESDANSICYALNLVYGVEK